MRATPDHRSLQRSFRQSPAARSCRSVRRRHVELHGPFLIPHQVVDARQHDQPRGNLSDLYPRWIGAKDLLLYGRDPYGADVSREIQIGYYGRPLDPSRPNDPADEQGFAYPVYVVWSCPHHPIAVLGCSEEFLLDFSAGHGGEFGGLALGVTAACSLLKSGRSS